MTENETDRLLETLACILETLQRIEEKTNTPQTIIHYTAPPPPNPYFLCGGKIVIDAPSAPIIGDNPNGPTLTCGQQ